MVVCGLRRIATGQWTKELAPGDSFDMAVHEKSVDHEIVAADWAAGLVVILVHLRIVGAAWIGELVLGDASLEERPLGSVRRIVDDVCAAGCAVGQNIRPGWIRILSEFANGTGGGVIAPWNNNAVTTKATIIGDGRALEGFHGLVP